jgi:hypothetical protein
MLDPCVHDMVVAGYILAIIGSLAAVYGQLRMLALAYRRVSGWLLTCVLLAPLCWFLLLAVDFKATAKPFILVVVGLVAAVGGGLMAGNEF